MARKQDVSVSVQKATVSSLQQLLIVGFLVVATVAAYVSSLHYAFQFDDIANIQKHFQLRHYDFFSLFFTGTRWISYWINSIHYSIGKFDPFSYRVGNLFIHTTNGVLVFLVLVRMLELQKAASFFKRHAGAIATTAAMLFLLHPVQTQTVSYVIQGELEGLACMAILSMTLSFLYAFSTATLPMRIGAGVMLFVIAIFSCGTKEIAIIGPGLLLLVDWFFVARGNLQDLKKRLLLHLALMCIVVGIYMYHLKPEFFTNILGFKMEVKNNIGNIITHDPQEKIGPWAFFISQFKVVLHYLWMFIWPFGISVEYDWVLCRGIFAPDCIFPFALLLFMAYMIYKLLQRDPLHPIAFGALWFFCCIAPRSSIIPSPELLVDYKTYTASIGWLFIIAVALVKGVELLSKRVAFMQFMPTQCTAACLFALVLGSLTVERNKIWRSGKEFWWSVIVNAPGKARAYNNYGVEIAQYEAKYSEAIPHYLRATQMDKNYADPWNNLAVCYSQLDRIDEAIEALKQGLRIQPYYPEGHNNLASFYLRKKDYYQAELYLQNALKLRPHYGKAHYNLGRLYTEKGDPVKALECFKNACTIADLDIEFGFKTYAQAAFIQKEYTEAIWGFEKTLACNPSDADALFSLGNAHYMLNDLQRAITIYRQLTAQQKCDPRVWFNLGEAYFCSDDIDNALASFKRIEQHTIELPQIAVRIAGCYEKKGDLTTAYNELAKLLRLPVGQETQEKAKELLAQLDAQRCMQVTA